MKHLLIISPYFPPVNAADMHRVRMSLPYLKDYGWEAEIITVDVSFVDFDQDSYLFDNLPKETKIHKLSAFPKRWTSKLGLGSIALRSLWFYKNYVDKLLQKQHFDLIYFSTTQFPLMILGAYWKKKFHIPYVIDMQDPWHSTYYQDKPKKDRPKKYWFSYRLNKYLEPIAMKNVDGLISVSQAYIDTLIERYPRIKKVPNQVITFGAFHKDFEFVKKNFDKFKRAYVKDDQFKHFVYVGRAGVDMKESLVMLFTAFKKGLDLYPIEFGKIRFHFIGTSYASSGTGIETITPIAAAIGLDSKYVNEQTNRISFYDAIYNLITADALVIIGSDDPQYTASKIYPYILAERPLMAFFNAKSSAGEIIRETNAGMVIHLGLEQHEASSLINQFLFNLVAEKIVPPHINWNKFEPYTAKNMTKKQCFLFNEVIS
ncbi:hypothetical protein EZ428_11065 [Pedobacter frigiditerrae]|uniref:Glycosyltransferase subfamily 4-like N-terminal domain-containing protein n=1 Tax=Pedobacter frigiditerrae TaxID=2530452 RepID=A0A4R0MY67_9SPHI|nr:glycosyltransferase [Pedobacter frigiditerrae]TCC92259.1 hypothetical protein EZ428_11065 [Pedobacter frigiditerrae]